MLGYITCMECCARHTHYSCLGKLCHHTAAVCCSNMFPDSFPQDNGKAGGKYEFDQNC